MYSPQKNKRIIKPLIALLIVISATAFSAQTAFAHAKLLDSKPANGEKLQEAPKAIELTFSERLQQTAMNSIVVTGENGSRADKKILVLSEDGRKMFAELEEIDSGTFTVEWKALSADDHLMKGKFTFTVAEKKMTEAAPTPPIANQQTSDNNRAISENKTISDDQTPPAPDKEEVGTSPLQSLVRWFSYLAMMTLFGGFAFLLFVLKPSLRRAPDLNDEEKTRAFDQGAQRFLRLTRLSLLLIFASAFLALVLQTSAVLNMGFIEALIPLNLYLILTQTGFGMPWFLQVAAALAILGIVFFIGRQRKNDPDGLNSGQALLWTGLILSVLMLGSLSLTGHARAAQEEYKFAIFSDWLHLIAAGIWVGGIFHLALTLPKSISGIHEQKRISVLSRVIPGFSSLAVACTILLALTGIYNSWIHLVGVSDLVTTPYGVTLLAKIILFLLMLPLGAFNRFFIRPRLEKMVGAADGTGGNLKTIKDFYFVMILEAAFAAAVLLLAAILAFLPHTQGHHAAVDKNNDAAKSMSAAFNKTGTIKR